MTGRPGLRRNPVVNINLLPFHYRGENPAGRCAGRLGHVCYLVTVARSGILNCLEERNCPTNPFMSRPLPVFKGREEAKKVVHPAVGCLTD